MESVHRYVITMVSNGVIDCHGAPVDECLEVEEVQYSVIEAVDGVLHVMCGLWWG